MYEHLLFSEVVIKQQLILKIPENILVHVMPA